MQKIIDWFEGLIASFGAIAMLMEDDVDLGRSGVVTSAMRSRKDICNIELEYFIIFERSEQHD